MGQNERTAAARDLPCAKLGCWLASIHKNTQGPFCALLFTASRRSRAWEDHTRANVFSLTSKPAPPPPPPPPLPRPASPNWSYRCLCSSSVKTCFHEVSFNRGNKKQKHRRGVGLNVFRPRREKVPTYIRLSAQPHVWVQCTPRSNTHPECRNDTR